MIVHSSLPTRWPGRPFVPKISGSFKREPPSLRSNSTRLSTARSGLVSSFIWKLRYRFFASSVCSAAPLQTNQYFHFYIKFKEIAHLPLYPSSTTYPSRNPHSRTYATMQLLCPHSDCTSGRFPAREISKHLRPRHPKEQKRRRGQQDHALFLNRQNFGLPIGLASLLCEEYHQLRNAAIGRAVE